MLCFSLSKAYIRSNQTMGWGEKAIEIRSVETGHLDGVFMHKRAQRLKFLCERNDKVRLPYSACALVAAVYSGLWSVGDDTHFKVNQRNPSTFHLGLSGVGHQEVVSGC